MAIENVELYEFLKDRECSLYKKGEDVRMWTAIPFYLLEDFANILGYTHFDDGGLDIKMFEWGVAVELNEIFESECEFIYEYRKCFEEEEFKKYEAELFEEYVTNK